MKRIRLYALALAAATMHVSATAQQTTPLHDAALSDANWQVGFGIGPSIGTEASLIQDFRVQERLYARRQFNGMLQAELGVGIHRVAGNHLEANEYDTHFWTFDARALLAPAIDEQWRPYGFAGVGYALYRVIDPADETVVTEGDPIVAEEGGGLVVPLGLGVQFKPERHSRIAIDLSAGYSMLLAEDLDGAAGGGNISTINGMLSLQYLFHDVE